MGKRELIALLNLSSWCLVMVERLFLAVPRGSLQFVIVVFPDHTHLLFFQEKCKNMMMRFQSSIYRNHKSAFLSYDLCRYVINHFRKHSYLDNWYHLWLFSTRQLQALGYMLHGRARGQNLGRLACKQQHAYQPVYPCSLISALAISYLDSIVVKLARIIIFLLVSAAEQTGCCLTFSKVSDTFSQICNCLFPLLSEKLVLSLVINK